MKINPDRRIKCPKCGSGYTISNNGRYIGENNVYVRTKKCLNCENKFNTIEMLESNYEASTMIARGLVKLIKENLMVEEDE